MAEDCGCTGDEFAALAEAPDDDAPDLHPDPRGNTVRRFQGLIAPYETPTGDGRRFAAGALGNRDLPIPLKWQRTDNSGHSTSIVVGRIDGLDYDDDGVNAWGIIFDPDRVAMPRLAEDCAEAWQLLKEKTIGPSVDLDDMQFHPLGDPAELSNDGARPEIEVTKGRISAATLVPIPAFAEARPFTLDDLDADQYAEMTAVTASGVATQLHELPVAADTQWSLAQWLLDEDAAGALYDGDEGALFPVAQEVEGQLSIVPAAVADAISVMATQSDGLPLGEGTKQALRDRLEELASTCGMDPPPWVAQAALVAAAGRRVLPADAFANPKLDGPTPLRFEDIGGGLTRVYGHVADFRTCHVGFQDRCITAPRSSSHYSYFHVGHVETDAGKIATGKITLGGGHAPDGLNFRAAAAHYDDTTTAVADVVAGEDRHGIWVSGVLRSGLSASQLEQFTASPLSGDWRRVGGRMEMIAAHAVNTPGFPIPHVHTTRQGDLTLVAAGMLVEQIRTDAAARKAKKKAAPKIDPDHDGDHDYSVDDIAEAVFQRLQKAQAGAEPMVAPEDFSGLAATLEDDLAELGRLDDAQLAGAFEQ